MMAEFKTEERWRTALLAGVFLLAGARVFGGEPVPPPPTGAEKPAEEKKTEEKKPSDEKPWVFESRGRRDPFTFAIKPTIVPDAIPGTTPGEIQIVLDPALIRQKKAEAEAKYAEAENIFMDIGKEGRSMEAIAKCDEGLKVLSDANTNYGSIPEWQPVRAHLENLRKASERMKQRQDAEKKFREVNIRLTGVVARERKSQAIVNGKTVSKGDIVAASDNYDVSVDDIHPDQVVFVTPDGFKVKLTWTEMSK